MDKRLKIILWCSALFIVLSIGFLGYKIYKLVKTDTTLQSQYQEMLGGDVTPDKSIKFLSQLRDVSVSSPATNDLLSYNGTDWINTSTITAINGYFTDLTAGNANFTTTTINELVTSTSAIISGSLKTTYLTSSSIPYIGTGGLLSEKNSTMYTDGTSAYFTSLYSGIISLPQNGGLIGFIDMPVTSASTIGTEHGAGIKIDGNTSFTVLRESDGAGSLAATTTIRAGSFTCWESVNADGAKVYSSFGSGANGATITHSTSTPCN